MSPNFSTNLSHLKKKGDFLLVQDSFFFSVCYLVEKEISNIKKKIVESEFKIGETM